RRDPGGRGRAPRGIAGDPGRESELRRGAGPGAGPGPRLPGGVHPDHASGEAGHRPGEPVPDRGKTAEGERMTTPTITHDLDLTPLGRWGCERVPGSLFWTVSGAPLYGFPSADSDIDLRGAFAASLRSLIGLRTPTDTHEPKGELAGREVEAVAHEAR